MNRLFLSIVVCGVCAWILASLPAGSATSKDKLVLDPPQPSAAAPFADNLLALANDKSEAAKKPEPKRDEPKPKPEKPGPKDGPKPKPAPGPFKLPKEVALSPQQEAKHEALIKKFTPQLEDLAEAEKAIYTEEQREQMKAARDAAHEAGKKGKEANDLVAAAIKLTGQQQEKLDELRQKRKALDEQIKAAVLDLLTPEQRELAKKGPGGPGKPKGPPPKKPENR
jgi:hypothetical protein